MSYGPQLPPNLRKPLESKSQDDDSNLIGPKLPSEPCRGPAPSYGPNLPSELCKPQEESDDDDVIGPRPPKPEDMISPEESAAKAIEDRAQRMKDRLEGKDFDKKQRRESWMLELPPEMKNFGLKARGFNTSTKPKGQRDESWARAPQDKAKSDASDAKSAERDHDVLDYLASLKRDEEMEKASKDLKLKRGSKSLLEMHEQEQKKKKKDLESGEKVRRPFDRDIDLQVNRFDEAAKKTMVKQARKIDDRFSSGHHKYL